MVILPLDRPDSISTISLELAALQHLTDARDLTGQSTGQEVNCTHCRKVCPQI